MVILQFIESLPHGGLRYILVFLVFSFHSGTVVATIYLVESEYTYVPPAFTSLVR